MTTAEQQGKYVRQIPPSGALGATAKLGDTVRQILDDRISPQQARFSSIIDSWQHLVPVELRQHCEVVGLSRGVLKVRSDSAVYMYELKLCSAELLTELQRQCPQGRIRKIELTVG